MDNAGFELQEEPPSNSTKPGKINQECHIYSGNPTIFKKVKKTHWSLLQVFLVCLLACAITIVAGMLTVSLVYVSNPHFKREPKHEMNPENHGSVTSDPKTHVDPKFQFLHHLTKSKKHQFPGGAIQWSRFRKNADEYQNKEEMAFGTSINAQRSKMMFGTLLIKSKGLRVPHWHFNANEQGYLLKGTAWIGVVDAGGDTVTTYNVTAGQIIFFPRNTLHWVKNVGAEKCLFLLFFTTHEELQTLDLDDTFFLTPEDIAARSLKPQGGVDFIRSFQKQAEDQAINLPPNLAELVQNANYNQSADMLVWRYFFDLKESTKFQFPGGIIQWARYVKDGEGLKPNEKIYSEFLHSKEDALTLGTLRIYSNGLRQPHFHFNANEMGYVISGCGKVGVIVSPTLSTDFTVGIGDVVFFPVGTQHYIKSTCDEDLLFILAFSTGNQLKTLDMDDYFHATADHILAQVFFKKQDEFKKIPRFKDDQGSGSQSMVDHYLCKFMYPRQNHKEIAPSDDAPAGQKLFGHEIFNTSGRPEKGTRSIGICFGCE